MLQTLRNVISLQAVRPSALSSLVIVPGSGAFAVGSDISGDELSLAAPAEIRDSTKTVDRTKVHTVQLTAKLVDPLGVDGLPWCFIAVTAQGERFLLGTADAPYPVSDLETVLPSKFTDPSVFNLSVQWTGTVGLLPLKRQDSYS